MEPVITPFWGLILSPSGRSVAEYFRGASPVAGTLNWKGDRGRTPNTRDLNLEAAGVETDARGFIPVDDHLRTSVEGIWALGDVNGRGAFTQDRKSVV